MCFAEQFLSMIQENENEAVKWILEDCRLHHSVVDSVGTTLLHYAVEHENNELVNYLLDSGCPINSLDSAGVTPLMLSVKHNGTTVLRTLLAAEADIVNIKDRSGKTALHYALNQAIKPRILWPLFCALRSKQYYHFSSHDIAKLLIDENCRLNSAAFTRDYKIIEYMLEKGVPIVKDRTETDYIPALHVAVGLHDIDTVTLLLKHGADVHELDYASANALSYLHNWWARIPVIRPEVVSPEWPAIINDHNGIQVLKVLLNAGISVTSITGTGRFNITRLLLHNNCQVIRLLLKSNANLNARDNYKGRTILHYLAKNNNPGIIDEVKRHINRFNVNTLDYRGKTALDQAVWYGNTELTKLLLDYGAPANMNAVWFAYSSGRPLFKDRCDECAELLFQYNANPQVTFKTKRQKTIFDLATENNHLDRINLAIAHLALLDKKGVTITELIASKIDSNLLYKSYLEKCQKVLGRKIHGSVSFFQMLTADQRKLAKYLNNDKLVRKLIRIGHKQSVTTFYRYYYNILKQRYAKACYYKTRKQIATSVLYDIFGDYLYPTSIITEKVIDYLNIC